MGKGLVGRQHLNREGFVVLLKAWEGHMGSRSLDLIRAGLQAHWGPQHTQQTQSLKPRVAAKKSELQN